MEYTREYINSLVKEKIEKGEIEHFCKISKKDFYKIGDKIDIRKLSDNPFYVNLYSLNENIEAKKEKYSKVFAMTYSRLVDFEGLNDDEFIVCSDAYLIREEEYFLVFFIAFKDKKNI